MNSTLDRIARRTLLHSLATEWREWPLHAPKGVESLGDVNELLAVAVAAGMMRANPGAAAKWVSNMPVWLRAWVREAMPPSELAELGPIARQAGCLVNAERLAEP